MRNSRRFVGAASLALVAAVALAVGALVAWLPRMPDATTLHSAEQVRLGLARVEAALLNHQQGNAQAQAGLVLAVQWVDLEMTSLRAELTEVNLRVPELGTLELGWAQLRKRLAEPESTGQAVGALREQALHADGVAQAVRQQMDRRFAQLDLWLKVLMGGLVLALLLPLSGLWRQRRLLKRSLRQFSTALDEGPWQHAVQHLRDDGEAAPSTFAALATGVENVLGQSERRWQALADLSADWYWETDAEHRISWVSRSAPFLAAQGWDQDDVRGRRHDQVPFFQPPTAGWPSFQENLSLKQPFRELEFQVASRTGPGVMWVAVSGRARVDAQGRFVGYEGVGRDVTDRKLSLERLQQSEQRWSMMTGLASDWYWETDTAHRLMPLRPEQRARYGSLFDQLEGRTRWDAHRNSLTAAQWADHRADLEAHRPFRSLQLEVEGEAGRLVWISLSGIPRFDGQQRFRGYHGVGRDITARKEAERLLMRHNEALQRAVAERTRDLQQVNLDLDAFARQLAHELRTPIGHVQGLTHMLQLRMSGRLAKDEHDLLDMMSKAAVQMTATVDALMTLARSTLVPMPMAHFNLSALAHEVIQGLPTIARTAPVSWDIAEDLWVNGSEGPLKLVLTNLFGNAAKFTQHHAAPVVRLQGELIGDGMRRLRVVDNGVGFDPTRAAQLFRPFNRLHNDNEYAGTGIGLTIVQRIVERHNGSVSARSQIGAGACFEFTLMAASNPAISNVVKLVTQASA